MPNLNCDELREKFGTREINQKLDKLIGEFSEMRQEIASVKALLTEKEKKGVTATKEQVELVKNKSFLDKEQKQNLKVPGIAEIASILEKNKQPAEPQSTNKLQEKVKSVGFDLESFTKQLEELGIHTNK